MAEYIKRETLVHRLKSPYLFNINQRIFEIISEIPAADVAPVVRCENCAFSQSDGWVCGGTALMPQHRTFPNSFCSDGERKDGADG